MCDARHEETPAPGAAGAPRSTRPTVAGRALVYFDAERLSDRVLYRFGLEGIAQRSGRAAASIWEVTVSPRAAFRLVLAGRILRLRGHVIACRRGEEYPLAVLRVVLALPADVREALKAEVDFLESLGADGAPSPVIRERWAKRLSDPLQPGDE